MCVCHHSFRAKNNYNGCRRRHRAESVRNHTGLDLRSGWDFLYRPARRLLPTAPKGNGKGGRYAPCKKLFHNTFYTVIAAQSQRIFSFGIPWRLFISAHLPGNCFGIALQHFRCAGIVARILIHGGNFIHFLIRQGKIK